MVFYSIGLSLRLFKMGFLRRNSNGTTGYHIIERQVHAYESEEENEESGGKGEEIEPGGKMKEEESESETRAVLANTEKDVTIGNLMMGLQASSYSMSNYFEEKKDKTKPSINCFV